MAIKIVTDSTAYLPADFVAQHDIRVVPLKVLFGDRVYKDGVEITSAEFYQKLAEVTKLPTTSQPSVGEFQAVYTDLAAAGHEILSIHISGKLSGTVDSAWSAARLLPDAKIHVVDSLFTAFGLAMMVTKTAEAVARGRDVPYLLRHLDRMSREMILLFVVDTLEYLEKGGRIGAARALLGTLLKIKPILKLEGGLIVPYSTVRTKHKAIAFMIDQLVAASDGRRVLAAVAHAQVPDELAELQRNLSGRLDCTEVFTGEIGPVIGTHTGPGVLGAAICPLEAVP